LPARPEDRPNWNDWSQNRNENWDQRVDNRNDAWNQRADNREQARNDWQQNQDQRWNNIDNAREDRQNWRDQSREDWQQHRDDLWNYRGDRAEEIRDNARDFYDDVFDDRWWGACGWGAWAGHYPANPWWWWRRPIGWTPVANFVGAITSDPVYVDYGMNVIFDDEDDDVDERNVVYVDNQPVTYVEYVQPAVDLAVNVEQPAPPLPSEGGAPAEEWMPLGVFALAQEEKGDPVMFFQLSVNRAGVISGGYSNAMTGDERPVAGQVDKKTQRVAWRIGDNDGTIFETSLGNLTQDVSPIAVHFGSDRTQTWLLVAMPEPSPADKPAAIPAVNAKPPPLKKTTAPAKS
jgi:hypothetical protein